MNNLSDDIRFDYNDAEFYHVEIAVSLSWSEAKHDKHKAYLYHLLDRFELKDSKERIIAARSLLYILQGNFRSCELEEDQINMTRRNVYLCLEAGVLSAVLNLFLIEIDMKNWPTENEVQNGKSKGNMEDCSNLRVLMSIIYILVETVRTMNDTKGHENFPHLKRQFLCEINKPLLEDNKTTLSIILIQMATKASNIGVKWFPLKKILLLLWKVLLLTLGPISDIFRQKNEHRKKFNLPPLEENNIEIVKHLKTCCPPDTASDISVPRLSRLAVRHGPGSQEPRSGNLSGGRIAFQKNASLQLSLKKMKINDSLDTWTDSNSEDNFDCSSDDQTNKTNGFKRQVTFQERVSNDTPCPSENEEETSLDEFCEANQKIDQNTSFLMAIDKFFSEQKFDDKTNFSGNHLPWNLKVKNKDISSFLESAREKFLHLKSSHEDTDSLIGLPQPIIDAVKVLKEHVHVSIAELQLKLEENIIQHPFSMLKHDLILDENVEKLYSEIYPVLPSFLISLLKLILSAVPAFRSAAGVSELISEILPAKQQSSVVQSVITNTDIERHREILIKAASAIILVLLKRLKLNHIYQFEYVSQTLIFANYIPLALKFFNSNIENFIMKKNTIPSLEFPSRVIGKMEQMTLDSMCIESASYSARNLFICINFLRILNSLVKWKPCRASMMVAFKSPPILIRLLKIRQPILQFYVLKLLKLQSRFLGRIWRKNNMPVMSAIYQKVRHRLTDDWAYANDVEQKPQELHLDEVNLRLKVDKFNERRYKNTWINKDFLPIDNSLTTALNEEINLTDEFKNNYEKWLEEEVFSAPINWDDLLTVKCH